VVRRTSSCLGKLSIMPTHYCEKKDTPVGYIFMKCCLQICIPLGSLSVLTENKFTSPFRSSYHSCAELFEEGIGPFRNTQKAIVMKWFHYTLPYIINVNGGIVLVHVTKTLAEDKRSTSSPGRFILRKKIGTHSTGDWLGPQSRTGLF
jgi:hypothetical protein